MADTELVLQKLESIEQKYDLKFDRIDEKLEEIHSDFKDHENRIRGLEKVKYFIHAGWGLVLGAYAYFDQLWHGK